MRPRFSIRWLLGAFAVLAVAMYLIVVRPTAVAERFQAAVERGDLTAAINLCVADKRQALTETIESIEKPTVKVKIYPRSWSDLWKLRRSMLIQLIPAPRDSGSRLPDVGYNIETVATPLAIRPSYPYPITFGPSASGVREISR